MQSKGRFASPQALVSRMILGSGAAALEQLEPSDVVAGLVGDEPGVAFAFDGVEQRQLGTRMRGLAAHDQPGPVGPVGEINELGEFGHCRAGSFVAVLAHGAVPVVGVETDSADGGVDSGCGAGDHCETDVSGPGVPYELRAAGRVGADLDRPVHHGGIVAATVTGGDGFGELADGVVQHADVVIDAVRPALPGRSTTARVSPVASAKQ